MKDLIEALQIFLKYGDSRYPTHCEHDELQIADINPNDVSKEDKARLDELGFFVSDEESEDKYFMSFKFGSC